MRVSIKFSSLPKSMLKNTEPEGEKLDFQQFVRIVKRDLFKGVFIPHDMTLWLSLIGEKDIEELMAHHALLMDIQRCSESFTLWYDLFLDLARSKKDEICRNLNKYKGWQNKINCGEGNGFLVETLLEGSYDDTIEDLLRLLRNSRQHSSRYRHALYASIVGQNFPNLISDFQKELYKAGCLKELGVLK
ncbi:uncharacterized protein C2845_PM03G16680 [Panicum miliaceum]|uniref:Uncharacterized protein n=1 Tax=Panicum miliaceum TaxID=4540 RepID=A0A3L6TDI4_PANMI|nr:uncharacterized protein C2845_PM03G16680 [Panicum miliaceum]